MKIAFVVHDFNRNFGQSRYVAELATRFAAEHEVHVYANSISGAEGGGIHFHRVPAWRATSISTVVSFAVTASTILPRDCDIIHAQGFCCYGANVLTTHICSRAWHRAYREHAGTIPLRHSVFNHAASCIEYVLYRFSANARVIAISERARQDIRKYYSCTLPTELIYHGVDLHQFSPSTCGLHRERMRSRLGIGRADFVLLFVGDLRKGARECIAALHTPRCSRLILLSRSDAEPYRRLADELGKGDRVHFAQFTSNVEEYYAAADALVLPSFYDTFGMVVLEAMACGLPVIVARQAGVSELVRHGINGFVLPDASDTGALAALMHDLEQDRRKARCMGRNARDTAEEHSWDIVAERTMHLYEAVLKTHVVNGGG